MGKLFATGMQPLLFGHRGYSSIAPENTLPAFQMCLDRGIPGIELDVHVCKSGELVVIHDTNLKRIAGVDRKVEDLTFQELQLLDVGSHKDASYANERIPLLADVLDLCGNAVYYDIELKCESPADNGVSTATWQEVVQFGLQEYVMVSSFNPFTLRTFEKVSSRAVPTAVIYAEDPGVPMPLRHGWGRHLTHCTYLKPDFHQIDARTFAKMHTKHGYPIVAWTVNEMDDCKSLLDMGVDGIISNNPADFLDLVKEAAPRTC